MINNIELKCVHILKEKIICKKRPHFNQQKQVPVVWLPVHVFVIALRWDDRIVKDEKNEYTI